LIKKCFLKHLILCEKIKANQKAWRDIMDGQKDYIPFAEIYEDFNNVKEKYLVNLSLTSLKQKIMDTQTSQNDSKITTTCVYSRSILVKEYARRVANGICQLCEKEAPFFDRNGKPFLEVHHIHYLSLGGSDTLDNVIALCPNCHRKIHQLEIKEDTYKLREKALELIKK
jgi:5-methylcytosine-specific restriction endonuclease McrA